jgi:hypothetical protein
MDLLRLVETTDGPIEYAATTAGLDLNEARAFVNAAEHLRMLKSGNGAWRHRFCTVTQDSSIRSIVPTRACLPNDLEIVSRFAAQIQALHSDASTRSLLEFGVEAYVNSVWSKESYAVFHHPAQDGKSARSFLDLLRSLDIKLENIHFELFDSHKRSKWTKPWRQVLGISTRFPVERHGAIFGPVRSSESWLAIEPEFGFDTEAANGSGIFGFRFLMVMAYINFRASQE